MAQKTKQTAGDVSALAIMPDGWFTPTDVCYEIQRPSWRCDRMVELGLLEAKQGTPHRQYRKIKQVG